MIQPTELLARIEAARQWNFFHKDWLLQIRQGLCAELPGEYRVFVESDEACEIEAHYSLIIRHYRQVAGAGPEGSPGFSVQAGASCDSLRPAPATQSREYQPVAAVELLSASNKGLGNRLDRQRHLRKRAEYLDAGINLLEIDALLGGERDLPPAIMRLNDYQRVVWTANHDDGRRRYRGWGWNAPDPLPSIDWQVDLGQTVLIDLVATLQDAVAFNDWEALVS